MSSSDKTAALPASTLATCFLSKLWPWLPLLSTKMTQTRQFRLEVYRKDLQDFIFKNFSNPAASRGKRQPSYTEICKMSCTLSQIYCYFLQMSIWFICEVMREKLWKKLLEKNKQNRTLLNNTPACSVGFLRVFEREVLSRLNLCRPNDTSFVFLTPMGLLEEQCGRLRCESFSADGLVPFSEPPPLLPQKKETVSTDVQYISYVGK